MPKSQMPLNFGRVVFVRQGNQINAKAMWVLVGIYFLAKFNIEVNLDFCVRVGYNDFPSPLLSARLRA